MALVEDDPPVDNGVCLIVLTLLKIMSMANMHTPAKTVASTATTAHCEPVNSDTRDDSEDMA
jgi:hypothetical protein